MAQQGEEEQVPSATLASVRAVLGLSELRECSAMALRGKSTAHGLGGASSSSGGGAGGEAANTAEGGGAISSDGSAVSDTGVMCAAVRLDLPHVKQLAGWDCGVACLQMVLGLLATAVPGSTPAPSREQIMARIGTSVKSVWTIDLAMALESFLREHRAAVGACLLAEEEVGAPLAECFGADTAGAGAGTGAGASTGESSCSEGGGGADGRKRATDAAQYEEGNSFVGVGGRAKHMRFAEIEGKDGGGGGGDSSGAVEGEGGSGCGVSDRSGATVGSIFGGVSNDRMAAFHALAYSPDDTTAARADDSAANNTVDAATSNSDGNSNSCSNSSSGLPRVAFYTRVLGVQEEYGDFDFYKEEIATDTLRVGALFRRAAEAAAELEVEAGEGGRGGAAPPAAPRVVQATLDISTLCDGAAYAVVLMDLPHIPGL